MARLLLIATVLMATSSLAAEVEDLYEAQVPVTGQGEAERVRALASAFEAVLVKVTGQREVTSSAGIRDALKQPMAYVQQFQYRALPPELIPDRSADRIEGAPRTQALQVRFDAQAVNRLVQQAGIPLWGRVRPTTLVWIAVEDQGQRYLLGADDHAETRALLGAEAQRRGLPILLPLLDVEDRRSLFFTDVWGNFPDAILQASARYQAPAVMVGRLLRESGRWSARWTLYHEGSVEHWKTVAGEGWEEVFAGGIDGTADLLGARYARAAGSEGDRQADLAVTGIRGLADYQRAMNYLRTLDQVRDLQVLRVEADSVWFRARLGGETDALARTIAFGTTLTRIGTGDLPAPEGDSVELLSYRLLP